MDPLKINVAISQIKGDQGPGYFRENDSEKKEYHFYWVSPKQEIGLLSKTYKTAKSRNHAQKQVEEGSLPAEPFEADGLFGYAIRTKNGSAIAMGPLFPNAEMRDALMKQIRSAPASPPSAVCRWSRKDLTGIVSASTSIAAVSDGQWQGKVSYPLSQDKRSFKGMDMDTIKEFVELHSVLDDSLISRGKCSSRRFLRLPLSMAGNHFPLLPYLPVH